MYLQTPQFSFRSKQLDQHDRPQLRFDVRHGIIENSQMTFLDTVSLTQNLDGKELHAISNWAQILDLREGPAHRQDISSLTVWLQELF